jgi:hypothetical protein
MVDMSLQMHDHNTDETSITTAVRYVRRQIKQASPRHPLARFSEISIKWIALFYTTPNPYNTSLPFRADNALSDKF